VAVPGTPSLNNFYLESLINRRYTHALCLPAQLEQRITIHWPADREVHRAPKPMHLVNAAGEYESTYVAQGAELTVTRSFKTLWTHPICTSADADTLAEFKKFIAADRAQVIVLASAGRARATK
jgi:hypothetical protein